MQRRTSEYNPLTIFRKGATLGSVGLANTVTSQNNMNCLKYIVCRTIINNDYCYYLHKETA